MEKYISRCHKKLKEYYAPLENWYCTDVIDVMDDSSEYFATCELCGCEKVRFIHVMEHDEYFDLFKVGCICAGVMEGDILAAKERDRKMKNRAKRKKNFLKQKWQSDRHGGKFLMYKGQLLTITESNGYYRSSCGGKETCLYKGKKIKDFLSAVYAAFDLLDPKEKLQ